MKTNKLDFIYSRKFWALVAIGVVGILKGMNVLETSLADSVMAFLYGFIGVNLATKVVDKI